MARMNPSPGAIETPSDVTSENYDDAELLLPPLSATDPAYTVALQMKSSDADIGSDVSTGDDDGGKTTDTTTCKVKIPALAFGLYKVPDSEEGERIILDAIHGAGYRHFDSASIYGNEKTLGRALAKSLVPRSELFIASKVWNDAQRNGRIAVRASVVATLNDLGCEYLDVCYLHWPVPGCFVEAYKELQCLQKEGRIRCLGISNFGIADYEELMTADKEITVLPQINQIEVSPFMYRPQIIQYFQDRGILVAASKALHRGDRVDEEGSVVNKIAHSRSLKPAQVVLRWSLQHNLIVLTKTSSLDRMIENRSITGFTLLPQEMMALDGLTTPGEIRDREELEFLRKSSI